MKRLRRWQWGLVVALGCLVLPDALLKLFFWNLGRSHQHCIKVSGSMLEAYATDHEGRFPFHTNGFGDALALLVAEDDYNARYFVGVDDDGAWLRTAATNHAHVTEDQCTRIYVQGLTETNNPMVAILFDRYAVRGGDHFRGVPGQPYLREVCLLDGSMQTVSLSHWPSYASNQVELLVREGIPRTAAEAYYRPTLDPNAKR